VRLLRNGAAVLGLVVWLAAGPGGVLRAETAAELIAQARQYDCGYTAGPEASQAKALEIYRKALAAHPDPPQRLQILFRLAQLHSTAYLVHQGEKPNYLQAISCYQQILATYPTDEPLVVQSMTALADCFINLRRFDEALYWSKRTLGVSTRTLEEKVKASETQDLSRHGQRRDPLAPDLPLINPVPLQRTLRQVQGAQCAAVDQIAEAAGCLDSLRADARLQTLVEEYPGTCIARRARAVLDRRAATAANALAPGRHLPLDSETLMAHGAAPAATLPSDPTGADLNPSAAVTLPAAGDTVPAGQTDGPSQRPIPSRSPRGPPLGFRDTL
jgi:tetratricopeptide (TPR) repeat protein